MHAYRLICISPWGMLPFSVETQVRRLHGAQAKPKIKATDHPIPDLSIEIEGNGHIRGKACLMLNRTSEGVEFHAFSSTP